MLNTFLLNEATLNADALYGEGTLISIEQDVELQLTGAGTLISIEQEVVSEGQGVLISIAQEVVDEVTFYDKNDWDVSISLGGQVIPKNQIVELNGSGDIVITKQEGDNTKADFSIMPGAGTYNLFDYQGKAVTIDVRIATGWYRVFTGIVDVPRVRLIEEKITLSCIANRETLIRQKLTPYVASFGYYSPTVAGTVNDVVQEVAARLETIPYSLDFDGSNNWQLAPWLPKATADFVYGSSAVYYDDPEVFIESGKDVINKINISFVYSYQRLHQRQMTYAYRYIGPIYNAPIQMSEDDVCTKLIYGLTIPTKEMIRAAAETAGWKTSNMTFDRLWNGGWYDCAGAGVGGSSGKLAWSPVQTTTTTAPLLQNGQPVLDSQGNQIYRSAITEIIDQNEFLTIGATWSARKRFSQNISESYTLTIQSPQSQSIYGVNEEDQSYSLQSDFDPQGWEDSKTYDSLYSGTQVPSPTSNVTYYIDKDDNLGDFNQAMLAAINKASTRILSQHRDSRIEFSRFITPQMELHHTVELTGKWVTGKGKCRSIVHELNIDGEAKTKVELAVYRSIGSGSTSSLVPPTRPSDVPPTAPTSVQLVSRWGYNPATTGSASWVGYVGNAFIVEQDFSQGYETTRYSNTTYQESFIVDTPPIPATYRDNRTLAASASYNVAIPNNSLSAIFYWSPP